MINPYYKWSQVVDSPTRGNTLCTSILSRSFSISYVSVEPLLALSISSWCKPSLSNLSSENCMPIQKSQWQALRVLSCWNVYGKWWLPFPLTPIDKSPNVAYAHGIFRAKWAKVLTAPSIGLIMKTTQHQISVNAHKLALQCDFTSGISSCSTSVQ